MRRREVIENERDKIGKPMAPAIDGHTYLSVETVARPVEYVAYDVLGPDLVVNSGCHAHASRILGANLCNLLQSVLASQVDVDVIVHMVRILNCNETRGCWT